MPGIYSDPDPEDEDLVNYQMNINDLERSKVNREGYQRIVQHTSRGEIEARFYPAPGTHRAVLYMGGIGGGFDSPVHGELYPTLCRRFQKGGIAGLRVRFRYPTDLTEAVMDVLAGISFLGAEGIDRIALVGHSFGGAVVVQAAVLSLSVRACVTLATQGYGTEAAARLGPRCALLIVHGEADRTLPSDCSREVYAIAREPKQLLLKEDAGHGLDEWADELPGLILDWVGRHLPE
jgi:pimeloyl-ACP methyl ester carboxylesterase